MLLFFDIPYTGIMKNDTACLHTAIPCSACPRVPRIVDVRALTRRHTPTVVTAPIHCGHRSNEVTVDAVRGRGDGKREEGPVQSRLDRMTAWRGGGERGRDGRRRERGEDGGQQGGQPGERRGEEERNCSTAPLYVRRVRRRISTSGKKNCIVYITNDVP